jgi:predicted permease
MGLLSRVIGGIHALWHRKQVEGELDEELRGYLDIATDQKMAAGMSPTQALRAARAEMGSVDALKDQIRDVGWESLAETFWQDTRYAIRMLPRSPGFTAVAVLSLALGIGANTAIFSLMDAVLLRMLPVDEPRQLVEVSRTGGGTLSYPMYEVIRDRNQVFSGVLSLSSGRFAASARLGDIDAGDVHLSPVSGDYFMALGVAPVIGRALTEEDLAASNTTVISYELWQRAFATDPAVLGRELRLGPRMYTIVGVAPAGFTGVATGQPVDVWVPITWMDRQALQNPVALMLRVMARRKPGISEEQARADMGLLARQWSADWKFEHPMPVEVAPAGGGLTQLRRMFWRPLLVLMTVVALLLLMTAANVANLLLARASARQREMGFRLALGASRWRLIRQLLTESLVLGGAGAALGVLCAPGAAAFLARFLSSAVGRFELSFSVDARVLAFTLATSIVVVLLFGLAPALATTRLDLSPLLSGGASVSGRGDRRTRPGKVLAVAQIAISCVLLVGAVLFARSLGTLTHLDAGFQRENVLLLSARTSEGGPTGVERVRLYERVLERLARVPGVRSTALSSESLFSGNAWTEAVNASGFAPRPGEDRDAVLLVISPDFFRTMRTPMVRGRDFDPRDDEHGPRVAIVNEAMARYYFGGTEAIGRTFQLESRDFPQPLTIVGLVQDAKYSNLREPAPRIVYLPYLQVPAPIDVANIAVWTAANPEMMVDRLWKEARAESPGLRLGGSTTQARLVDATIARDRMLAQLSGFFGLTAAALVCLGLYGLTAYEVSRRTAEIGVRIALGAQRSDVVRLVFGRSMALVASGVALGLGAAVALARLVENLLFGVRSTDAVTLLLSAAMLLGVGAAAAYAPARRAASLDPIASLKYE